MLKLIDMSDSGVASRLKTFIEHEGLSYSQFADSCGIPRPSLSQLLTGRNKKINDIMVRQIHTVFPNLSVVWLLFGEGPMEVGSSPEDEQQQDSHGEELYGDGYFGYENDGQNFTNKIIFSTGGQSAGENRKENGLKNGQNGGLMTDLKDDKLHAKIKELTNQINILKKNPRKAVQITVYYDDSTFETFYPGNQVK